MNEQQETVLDGLNRAARMAVELHVLLDSIALASSHATCRSLARSLSEDANKLGAAVLGLKQLMMANEP